MLYVVVTGDVCIKGLGFPRKVTDAARQIDRSYEQIDAESLAYLQCIRVHSAWFSAPFGN